MSYYGASKTKTDRAVDAMAGSEPVQPNKAWYEEEKAKAEKRKKDEEDDSYWSNAIQILLGNKRQ